MLFSPTSTAPQPPKPATMAPPPPLPDEVVEEILLRLQPDDPSCLLRASLVCKTWIRAVSRPDFRRRLHALHRAPPVLGFLHNLEEYQGDRRFVPACPSPSSLPAPDRLDWIALDCRHGRALFRSEHDDPNEFLVWEPITARQWRVPVPAELGSYRMSAAIVCAAAAGGCDHSDCHGGPFRVLLISPGEGIDEDGEEDTARGATYLPVDLAGPSNSPKDPACSQGTPSSASSPGMATSSSTTWLRAAGCDDLDSEAYHKARLFLMAAEDGGLGIAEYCTGSRICLWSREASSGDAGWIQSRFIDFNRLLPAAALASSWFPPVVGFAVGANAIAVRAMGGIFTIELPSQRAKKVVSEGRVPPIVTLHLLWTEPGRGEY